MKEEKDGKEILEKQEAWLQIVDDKLNIKVKVDKVDDFAKIKSK